MAVSTATGTHIVLVVNAMPLFGRVSAMPKSRRIQHSTVHLSLGHDTTKQETPLEDSNVVQRGTARRFLPSGLAADRTLVIWRRSEGPL
jgi:hypothetical protein